MGPDSNVNSFFDYYEMYVSTSSHVDKYQKSLRDKQCRFCGKTSKNTTFNNIPHIVPELFGRNDITSNFECDSCNQKYQRFENDAATFVQHYLALLNIKSKRGVPTFQSKKKYGTYPTILRTDGDIRNFNFNSNLNDFNYDKENKTFVINFRTKNFIPFHVYKVFLKIGVSLLSSDDLKENEHFVEILNYPNPLHKHQIFSVWRYTLKTKYFLVPVATLYKAKKTLFDSNTQIPEYVFTLYTGILVFQMFLPLSQRNYNEHTKGNNLHMDLFPAFGMEDIRYIKEVVIHHMDFSETKKVSITDTMKMYYDDIDENITE